MAKDLLTKIVCISIGLYVVFHAALEYSLFSFANFPASLTGSVLFGRDFVNTFNYAWLYLDGTVLQHFDQKVYLSFLREAYGPSFSPHNLSYPPNMLPLIWPLGRLPYGWALLIWSAGGVAAIYATLKVAGISKYWPLAIALPAVFLCLICGQTGLYTGALLVSAMILRHERPVIAGILFGLLTVKPQMGLLIPFLLLFERRWLVIQAACASSAILVALSIAMVGIEGWSRYFELVVPYQKLVLTQWSGIMLQMMPTAFINARLAGLDHYAAIYQILTSTLTLVLITLAFFKRIDSQWLTLAVLIATATLSPYFFSYDLVGVALAALVILATRNINTIIDRWVIGLALTFPALMTVITLAGLFDIATLPVTSAILIAMLTGCVFRKKGATGARFSNLMNHSGTVSFP